MRERNRRMQIDSTERSSKVNVSNISRAVRLTNRKICPCDSFCNVEKFLLFTYRRINDSRLFNNDFLLPSVSDIPHDLSR